jgi:hypothetical protein
MSFKIMILLKLLGVCKYLILIMIQSLRWMYEINNVLQHLIYNLWNDNHQKLNR